MTLEVCTGTPAGIAAAARGGASRIELCSALSEGGLTPSYALIRHAVDYCHRLLPRPIDVNVLIRPRGGDFLYTAEEKALILADAAEAVAMGADGIVVGALTEWGEIDTAFTAECVALARCAKNGTTFHRAFDLARDPLKALREVTSCGCQRLLSSGQAATAEEGIATLREMVRAAGGSLIVMPGCGVSPANANHILQATGAKEIHASARSLQKSGMKMMRADVSMGAKNADEYAILDTSEDVVRKIFDAINETTIR